MTKTWFPSWRITISWTSNSNFSYTWHVLYLIPNFLNFERFSKYHFPHQSMVPWGVGNIVLKKLWYLLMHVTSLVKFNVIGPVWFNGIGPVWFNGFVLSRGWFIIPMSSNLSFQIHLFIIINIFLRELITVVEFVLRNCYTFMHSKFKLLTQDMILSDSNLSALIFNHQMQICNCSSWWSHF